MEPFLCSGPSLNPSHLMLTFVGAGFPVLAGDSQRESRKDGGGTPSHSMEGREKSSDLTQDGCHSVWHPVPVLFSSTVPSIHVL